nr:eukaryotic peptide chain release factor GTP-binding subunit ERF3A-like isoform X1 [Ipomoea batatas]
MISSMLWGFVVMFYIPACINRHVGVEYENEYAENEIVEEENDSGEEENGSGEEETDSVEVELDQFEGSEYGDDEEFVKYTYPEVEYGGQGNLKVEYENVNQRPTNNEVNLYDEKAGIDLYLGESVRPNPPPSDLPNPLWLGRAFMGKENLKDLVKTYGIQFGKELKFKKNDKVRCVVVCTQADCKWQATCRRDPDESFWRVTVFNDEHANFPWVNDNKLITSTLVAKRWKTQIARNSTWNMSESRETGSNLSSPESGIEAGILAGCTNLGEEDNLSLRVRARDTELYVLKLSDANSTSDIEEDIKALQLDSSEDTPMANADDGKPEEVVKSDETDTGDVKHEPQANSEPMHIEPKSIAEEKEKKSPALDDIDDAVELNKKRHLNVVFIGHVDAGKSTIGGQILFLSGQVDDRTIQKYEKEAKDKSRESWYMAYIMDTNEEERVKGITVEVGRAHFETETTRFTILDAPGHKSYVPNMISGASQADIGVLVISARKGEFETGYERGGQTREHVQLAKTLGVTKLLIVVNKMDEPTVNWSKERYDEIEGKMIPFLKSSGYNVKKDVQFLPISGLLGSNLKTRLDKSVCPWWNGPCLFEALDAVEVPPRDPKGPFRMPIIDKFKDMGTVVMGKVESGSIREGDNLLVMPNKAPVKVLSVFIDEDKVRRAGPGENLRVRLSGVEEEDILSGFVLCSVAKPVPAVTEFVAQLSILELLDNAIFTAGYKAVLHIHSVVEECEIVELMQQIDPKTKKPMKKKPLFVKNGAFVVCRIQVNNLICIEKFSDFAQLGRFTLRTEGKTVAVGKVTSLPNA